MIALDRPAVGVTLLFLLSLLLLIEVTTALRLGKPAPSSGLPSFAHRFPEDILAQPAFKVKFDDRTVTNATAQRLLHTPANEVEVGVTDDQLVSLRLARVHHSQRGEASRP